MTAPNEFDRRLTDWLQDGPSRAPERTIAFALDHAAARPRGRDPLRVLRRDAMGSPGFGGSMRVLPLVAALGLLLVAALAVATVGGFFDRTPAVVPPPSVPNASPTAPTPTVTPPSPNPTSPAVPSPMRVELIVEAGDPASVDIVDLSGRLLRAGSGTPGSGGSAGEGVIVANDPVDPNTLVLTWTGVPCDTTHDLEISADARTIAIERPPCGGDLLPLDRVLRLTFNAPVPAAEVQATITTTGG